MKCDYYVEGERSKHISRCCSGTCLQKLRKSKMKLLSPALAGIVNRYLRNECHGNQCWAKTA